VERWRQASQDANENPLLILNEQNELDKLRAQDRREIKWLKQELRRKEMALAEAVPLFMAAKSPGLLGRGRGRLMSPDIAGRFSRSSIKVCLCCPLA